MYKFSPIVHTCIHEINNRAFLAGAGGWGKPRMVAMGDRGRMITESEIVRNKNGGRL